MASKIARADLGLGLADLDLGVARRLIDESLGVLEINKYDLNAIFISGPGHGAPAVLSRPISKERIPRFTLTRVKTWPGCSASSNSFPSLAGLAATPLRKHPAVSMKGGELGYSVSHAYGTVYDQPDLISLVMVGDGESETGPLATSWHSNKFLNPITDGAVLPVLHLNGYKINNPTAPGPHQPRRAGGAVRRLRVHALFCGRE